MSERDIQEEVFETDEEQLDEFKASMGDPSEVPEPTSTKQKKRKGDKQQTDDPADSPTAVKAEKAKVAESKMGMIQAVIERMNGMSKSDLAAKYEQMLESLKESDLTEEEQDEEVTVVSVSHRVTSDDINIDEDMNALFGSDDTLTEEFKDRAVTIFEAAVVSKINEELEKVVVSVESVLEEERTNLREEMTGRLDDYMDYVVENWMEENKLAVESGIRSEMTESFIQGIRDLFIEHYVDIPEEQVDVLEELAVTSENLEDRLNEEIRRNAGLKKELEQYAKLEVFAESCESLTESQKEKFWSLAESVDYVDEENYAEKLAMLKESYFSETEDNRVNSDFDDSEPLEEETDTTYVDPTMSAYVSAISRTLKK